MRNLLISLGGDRYPNAPGLRHRAFGPSNRAVVASLTTGTSSLVATGDHLDLFDDDRSWPEQLLAMRGWLRDRCDREGQLRFGAHVPDNVFVHYVGHGSFKANSEEHLLTINYTDAEEKAATSVALGQLNHMLLGNIGSLRRFYIIDACFAAASLRDLMAEGDDVIEVPLGSVINAWPEAGQGTRGVAALCSADRNVPANAGGEHQLTQFTDGLVAVLNNGDAGKPQRLTLREIHELLKLTLQSRYGDRAVRPVLVAPEDIHGGVAGVPLFHNSAAGPIHATIQICPDAAEISTEIIESAAPAPNESGPLIDRPLIVAEEAVILGTRTAVGSEYDLTMALEADPAFGRAVYRFFRLPQSRKAQIVAALGLRNASDASLPELDRYKNALATARDQGKTGRLEVLIGEAEIRK